MKILILTQYFPPEVGAPQNRLFELAVRLKRMGAQVSVLTAMPNYPQMEIQEKYRGLKTYEEEMEGLKVYRSSIYVSKKRSITARLRNYFSFVWSSWKAGKKIPGNFDVLICESPPLFLGLTAMKLARKKKAKLVFNVSDLWPESAEKLGIVTNKLFLNLATRLEERIYSRSDLISGQTQGIVKNISVRFPGKKMFWLPNGVDTGFYKEGQEPDREWLKSCGLQPSDFILLYAGILGHAQGLEVILKAAARLKHCRDIKFVLLGSGPEKEKLLAMKKEQGLDQVIFSDTVSKDKMPGRVAAATAVVIPLRKLDLFKGAIPSKIFESLALQKPLLLGVEGEAKELFIDEGKCGLAFEPENDADLAEKIVSLYSNREQLREFGKNGMDYVKAKFTRDLIAEQFWKVLRELTGHKET
jgi:glycosyltransferase involved in cell wall biosynthesis